MRKRTAKVMALVIVGLLALMPNMGTLAQPPQTPPGGGGWNQNWNIIIPPMQTQLDRIEFGVEKIDRTTTYINETWMPDLNSDHNLIQTTVDSNGDFLFNMAYMLGQMDLKLDNLNQTLEGCCCMDDMGARVPVVHGPDKHTNRTHSMFIKGREFVADTGVGAGVTEFANLFWAGLAMPTGVVTLIGAPFLFPASELRQASVSVPAYIHLKENVGNAGDVKFDINVYGQDTSSVSVAFPVGSPTVTMAGSDYKRVFVANVDLSTLDIYDIAGVTIERTGTSLSDTLAGDIIVMGIEFVFPSDQ
jgi:hypothetical protein